MGVRGGWGVGVRVGGTRGLVVGGEGGGGGGYVAAGVHWVGFYVGSGLREEYVGEGG